MSLQKADWVFGVFDRIEFFRGKLKRVNRIGMDEVVKGINLNKFAISWIAIEQYRVINRRQTKCMCTFKHRHVNIIFGSQGHLKVHP